ncbi:virion structural protein [Halogranum tailed virus 1]|uniref:Uncharacterized protein n=1 Tax=Halogranum tailed virus 1 TaxID=1273749 RepID=R4T8W4_9CAUD|nr:virion structural protein [Halogranum tailed virus 1]AGM11340.1 hypothetical protein HGTV1_10 [Halogranum tailed virus 1]
MPAPEDLQYVRDLIYALENTSYINQGELPSESGIAPHTRTHPGGLQPDNDLVFERADGQAFLLEGQVNAGETIYSDWIDTDGWRTIEIVVLGEFQSAEDGVTVQFSRDIQAETPEIDFELNRTYANEFVSQGYGSWDFGTKLDGFRLKYTNGPSQTNGGFTVVGTLREPAVPDSADYVQQNPLGDNFVTVGTDPSLSGVGISEPASLFGDLQTIERRTVIDATSTFGTSILRDEVTSTGSGSVEENPAPSGEIHLSTGTTANSSIELQTSEYGRYTPGFSAQSGSGIRIPTLPTEGEVRWGYFSDPNGFYWGYDGEQGETFVARRRSGTEVERVYRSNWNRSDIEDELNRAWDPTSGDIYQIDFSWYGYGLIIFSIVTQTNDDNLVGTPNQRTIPVHAFSVNGETSTADPNEPIRVELENAGAGEDIDVYVGGRQFSVFGEPPAEQRITSQNRSGVSIGDTAWTHIMSWRRDPNEDANSKLNIDSFDTTQGNNTRYALVVNANVTDLTYQTPDLTNSDETLLQVSTAGTFNGIGNGTKVYESLAVGGSGNQSAGSASEVNARFGQNGVLSLLARSASGNSTVGATMRMKEDW